MPQYVTADKHAKLERDMHGYIEEIVTASENELRDEIKKSENNLRAEIRTVRTDLQAEIRTTSTNVEIGLRTELRAIETNLRSEMATFVKRMNVMEEQSERRHQELLEALRALKPA